MKISQHYCPTCQENKPFEYHPPCSGGESALWFIVGCFTFGVGWIILVLRNMTFSKKWNCRSCGGSNKERAR